MGLGIWGVVEFGEEKGGKEEVKGGDDSIRNSTSGLTSMSSRKYFSNYVTFSIP